MSTEELRKAVEDRSDFEACYLRANEVGILHRDDDGEYTSMFTKVAWALWQQQAQALRDQEAEIAELREKFTRYAMQASDYSVRISELACRAMKAEARAEKAESLLRECRLFVAWASERLPEATPTYDRITAHLGGENNG